MEMTKLLALASFVNGLFIAYVCICRLNSMHIKVIPSVRFKYVMLMVGALAFGSQPILWGEWPSTGGLVLQFCVTAGLAAGYKRWQSGPPSDTLIEPRNSAAGKVC